MVKSAVAVPSSKRPSSSASKRTSKPARVKSDTNEFENAYVGRWRGPFEPIFVFVFGFGAGPGFGVGADEIRIPSRRRSRCSEARKSIR